MSENKERKKIFQNAYQNVVLTDSHWKKQFSEAVEYYRKIPNDSLLFYFRERAGLPTPGQNLSGWYGRSAHSFGQLLGAFSKMYRASGDVRLKEKALCLAEEWIKCVDQEPSLLKQDTYIYEKLMGGLLDLYEYLGYEKALAYVSKLTDEAIVNFKRDIKKDGVQDEELSQNHMIEWYTLPENLYRAYELTGEEKYKEFAKVWDYDFLWEKAIKKDFRIGARHAYSHVNSLNSAARAYQVTQDEMYLTAMKHAYDEITTHHIFATGGYGPAESLFVDSEGYLGESLKPTFGVRDPMYTNFAATKTARDDTWGSSEIPCCAWAVFKFCNYMLQITGDAKYGDWAEKMLYNGTGAEPMIASCGKIQYYSNYFLNGAIKSVEDRRLQGDGSNFTWQCCTGTFPQDVAEYYNMLYYYDQDSIYVSQYLPSRVEWKKENQTIIIENFSEFPEESQLKFSVKVEHKVSFDFKFRIPAWVKKEVRVKINGFDVILDAKAKEWGILSREWENGDIITIDLPFDLYFRPVEEQNSDMVALNYGPLVLVTDEMTLLAGDVEKPEEWIHPVDGQHMTFVTDPGHVLPYDFVTRTFTPYYKVGEMKWYFMYNRIKELNNNE